LAQVRDFVELDPRRHDVKAFDCGKSVMNEFLARFAAKNMRLGLSRTWVLPAAGEAAVKLPVASYFTLAGQSVTCAEIPTDQRLPGYPVPVVLLARLAVDRNFARRGLGEKTLIYALRKALELTESGLPAFGVVLDVLDKDALRFYRSFDAFETLSEEPLRLFVSMQVIRQL
jgi:GNAT superfamily N-acetyltransferase